MSAQSRPLNARALVGDVDVALITFDTLRYDVAQQLAEREELPTLGPLLPGGRWERRFTPGTFTFAAHQAFFAGFLPTPARPGPHPRLFALAFEGSETTAETTAVLEDAPDIVRGLSNKGYRTLCIGGVGFFNKQTPLGRVMPELFDESHWEPSFGVTNPASTENQVAFACERLAAIDDEQRVFLFLNISALHQPNGMYLDPARRPRGETDDLESHAAALRYVDGALAPLLDAFAARGNLLAVLTSDHGTAYGEDGYVGHRHPHPVVTEVPYAEVLIPGARSVEAQR